MDSLSDFYRGDTKSWSTIWPVDMSGATVVFRLAKSKTQASYDLEITGSVDTPNLISFVIPSAASAELDVGLYYAEHELTTSGGEVTTFGSQKIKVLQDLPETAP